MSTSKFTCAPNNARKLGLLLLVVATGLHCTAQLVTPMAIPDSDRGGFIILGSGVQLSFRYLQPDYCPDPNFYIISVAETGKDA